LARGDAIVSLASVPALGNLDYQPSAGVEVLIKTIASEDPADAMVGFYDGANIARVLYPLEAGESGTNPRDLAHAGKLNMMITNSVYLRVRNLDSAAAQYMAYSGIQTK